MAIFQDQPISLQAIQGVNPEAFVQRAEREQQANAQQFQAIQQGIYQGIQNFENKRQEKQQKTASIEMLKQLGVVEGLSDKAIEAGINEVGATNFLKSLESLNAANAKLNEQNALNKAYSVSVDTEGNLNNKDFLNAYIDFGGTNLPFATEFAESQQQPSPIKIDEDGIISQGGKYMGQIAKAAIPKIPTKVLEKEESLKQIKKARELYLDGEITQAQDIITSEGLIDKITGVPLTPKELFGDEVINNNSGGGSNPPKNPLDLDL